MSRKSKRKQAVGKYRTESKRYLVLCEGEGEEWYAHALVRMLPRVSRRGFTIEILRKGDPNVLLKEARRRVSKAKKDKLPFDEVWLFFDHDNREGMEKVFVQIAKENWRFAFSNICFEVWLLLHFVDSPPKCLKPKEAVEKLQEHWKKLDRKGYSKNCNHFDALGDERRAEACARARKLRKNCKDNSPWQCNPWTNVDKLVAWVDSLGRKDV